MKKVAKYVNISQNVKQKNCKFINNDVKQDFVK